MAVPSNIFDVFAPPPAAEPRRRRTLEDELAAMIPPAATPQPPTPSVEPPPPDPTFLQELGGTALSGLGAAGNLLDLVPSMIRDVATLDNPFDQVLSPFSSEDRNTGRDVLTKWGMTQPNDPDAWELADVAGFAVDVASGGPLGGLGLGKSALSQAGRLAKNAGLLDDVMRVAPAAMGPRMARSTTNLDDLVKSRPGEAIPMPAPAAAATAASQWAMPDNWRQFLTESGFAPHQINTMTQRRAETLIREAEDYLSQHVDDYQRIIPDPVNVRTSAAGPTMNVDRGRAVSTAAKASGVDFGAMPDDALDSFMNQPVGGVAAWGWNPFGDPTQVFNGPTAQKIAGFMDDAGRAITEATILGTEFAPVREGMRLLSPTIGEAGSRVGRERMMPDIIEGRRVGEEAARGQVVDSLQSLITKGGDLADPSREAERSLRRIFEGIDLPPTAEMGEVTTAVRSVLDGMVPDANEWGINVGELVDNVSKYFPRFKTKALSRGKGKGPRIVNAEDPSAATRLPFAKGLGQGTDTLFQIMEDPVIGPMLGQADDAAVAAQIGQRFGAQVPERFVDTTSRGANMTGIEIKDRREALARWLNGLDDAERQSGVFGNHPLQDLAARTTNFQQSLETAKRVVTNLADMDMLSYAKKTSRTTESVPLAKVLQGVGLATSHGVDEAGNAVGGGALRKWLELQGIPVNPATLKTAGEMQIPKDFADDVMRVDQLFKGPAAVAPIIKAIDDATGLFKVGVLTWPARYVRDLTSGQFQNFAAKMWSPKAVKQADEVLRGKPSELADIPWVKEEMRRSGMTETPANAADALRKLAFRFKIVGRVEPISLPNATNLASGSGLNDMLAEVPSGTLAGRGQAFDPVTQAADKLKGRDTTYNPLKAEFRGVGEGADNTFAPAAAGDIIGHYTDGLNRLTPFIEMLRKGVHPKEAARRIRDAQVDYSSSAQTRFGREALGRAFPFWKFTAGSVPYTLSQLWERPGGRLAQTIRLSGGLSHNDASTPDYVAETASIPLGTLDDGSRRYMTGFGLMHEDPLSFLGGGVRGALTETLSRSNPLIKAPLEWASGESFFQKGPTGGRELSDLDPTVGRIMSNIVGADEPVTFPGSDAVEFVLANSPAARLLTSARTATDPRKSLADKFVGLGTGMRFTDVSPSAQDAVLRERIQAAMRDEGAKKFDRIYFPEDRLAGMGDDDRQQAESLQQGLNDLVKRAKARRVMKALAGQAEQD